MTVIFLFLYLLAFQRIFSTILTPFLWPYHKYVKFLHLLFLQDSFHFYCFLINLPRSQRVFLSNDIPTARTGRACRGTGRRRRAGTRTGAGEGTKNGEYERGTQTVGASQLLTRVPQTVRTSFRRFLSRFWCESKSSFFLQHLSVYDLTSHFFMFLMFSLAPLFIL